MTTARTIKLLGLGEVLGAIGLILPLALGIAPILTPLAAIGHLTMMIGAIMVHMRHNETWLPPFVLAVLGGHQRRPRLPRGAVNEGQWRHTHRTWS